MKLETRRYICEATSDGKTVSVVYTSDSPAGSYPNRLDAERAWRKQVGESDPKRTPYISRAKLADELFCDSDLPIDRHDKRGNL